MAGWKELGFSEHLTPDQKDESKELNRADEKLWRWAQTDIGPRVAKLLGGTGTKLKRNKEFRDMEWILLLDGDQSLGTIEAEMSIGKPYRPIVTIKLNPQGIERLESLLDQTQVTNHPLSSRD